MARKLSKRKRLRSYIKKNWQQTIIWLVGVIVVILLTKTCDSIWPDTPVVIKEYVDSVKVLHSINLMSADSDSVMKKQLEQQLMNIELLNKYEKQIASKRKAVSIDACRMVLGNPYPNSKGYTIKSASSFCLIELKHNKPFVDIVYTFIREDYVDLVNTLCVKITRKDNGDGGNIIVSDMNYEPHKGNNGIVVRMVNDFPPGQYTIEAGFILKVNRLDKYPAFYRQAFIFKK
jgi:hypothetical protein